MPRLYAYLIAIAGCIAILGGAAWKIDSSAYKRGKGDCMAERQANAEKAQAEVNRRDERSAEARTSMLDYLAAEKPAIEIRTHDTITKVETLYLEKPIPAGQCVRPAGVRTALEQTRERDNAAARGLRYGADPPSPAHP